MEQENYPTDHIDCIKLGNDTRFDKSKSLYIHLFKEILREDLPVFLAIIYIFFKDSNIFIFTPLLILECWDKIIN